MLASFNYYPSIPALLLAATVTIVTIVAIRRRGVLMSMGASALVGAISGAMAALAGSGDMRELTAIPFALLGGGAAMLVGAVTGWLCRTEKPRSAGEIAGSSDATSGPEVD